MHLSSMNPPLIDLSQQIPLLSQLQPIFAAWKKPVYLVGGAVRDLLLGRTSPDLDFVVSTGGIQLAFWVGNALGVPAFPLDKQRDTGRVVLEDLLLDFAAFRGATLTEDLQDRDFTINALAMPALPPYTLIDPTNGLTDLQNETIRYTHPAAFSHDPIRVLRAVRMAVQLGFAIESATQQAMLPAALLLQNSSLERVRDELNKWLKIALPDQAFRLGMEQQLLAVALPEMVDLVGVVQSPPHHEPVWEHTLTVLRYLVIIEKQIQEPNMETELGRLLAPYANQIREHLNRTVTGDLDGHLLLRWAALWHDAGKPATQTMEENGRIRFLGHDRLGATLAAKRLRYLRFSNEAIGHVQTVVAGHMRPLLLCQQEGITRRAIYRFFRDLGSAGIDVCLLSLADDLATNPHLTAPNPRLLSFVAQSWQHYFEQYQTFIHPAPLVTGHQLMQALNLPSSPEVGRLLRLIEEARADGLVQTMEEAIAFAQNHYGA